MTMQDTISSYLRRGTALALVALSVAGCAGQQGKKELTTGSIPKLSTPVASMNATELAAAAERIGQAYERNPKDREAGLNYANLLRMTGRNEQALAVMQQVAINHPTDREVLGAYGKAQAAAGVKLPAEGTIFISVTDTDKPAATLLHLGPGLANAAATLDHMSGGRLILGIGAGWYEGEFRAYGYPWGSGAERIARLGEALEIIARFWRGTGEGFTGRHYRAEGTRDTPAPLQQPRPPIWVGGPTDAALRRA